MKSVRVPVLALIIVLGAASLGPRAEVDAQEPAEPAAGISAEALAQIAALIADKQARTPVQQKIDSQLLYEQKMEAGDQVADGIWAIDTDIPYASDGHLIVDVQAESASAVAARLAQSGVEIESAAADGSSFRAHVDIADVETLAADPAVIHVEPRQNAMASQVAAANVLVGGSLAATGQGSRSSEGDVTHRAFAARLAYSVDGSGVKIGVLSDGVRNLAASQARGDLGAVTVIGRAAPCAATSPCDEGTAMLEIVHDVAPGAQLFFASALPAITNFADNIRALRAAGCDIIVDDESYLVESAFQDGQLTPSNTNGGVVTQAVNDVTASGALYFSAAGNSGNLDAGTSGVWEGDFADGGPVLSPPLLVNSEGPGARIHTFRGQPFNVIAAPGLSQHTLKWSDPLGRSTNDYDLFRISANGATVLSASTNFQTGTQDPYESLVAPTAAGDRLVVVKFSGAPRYLHLNTNGGRLSIATAGQTYGHAAAAAAFAVAATPASAAYPYGFNSMNAVETFSSDGPRRLFFRPDGTPFTPGNLLATGGIVRQKPDVTAADGVSVTGVGGLRLPFSGTSAAAAHAAAIAALVKSAKPSLTPAEIRSILTSTAIDVEPPGVDRNSGAGILSARDAVAATGAAGTAFLTIEAIDVADNPGNGNGIAEVGEAARAAITLKNNGGAPATKVAATLTSSSSGLAIAQPNTMDYGTLAPAAAQTRMSVFMTPADFGCPANADFLLNAGYGGGPGALIVPFSVPIGMTTFAITRTLDGTTPPSFPSVAGSTRTQNFRLNREGTASACGAQKPAPPIAPQTSAAGGPGTRRFDSYAFTTCGFSTPSCVSVTFGGPNSLNMFSDAYAPTFDPANITANYKADPATSSSGALTYSFDLPAGSSQFAVNVNDVAPNAPTNSQYTLVVQNACLGDCAPPNHPPVAKAAAVTVAAGPACTADASVDDGSSDADGEPLTFVQSPAGPYALGTTSPVLLTVTDPKGAFGQATGAVTVLDQTPPSITGLAPSPAVLSPPNHRLVDVAVNFTSADNCGDSTCTLTVTSDARVRTHGDDDHEDDDDGPDFVVVDAHHVKLRADKNDGNARTYTLTLTCTDAADNATVRTTTVVVPSDRGKGKDN
jgi:hypothetical protein